MEENFKSVYELLKKMRENLGETHNDAFFIYSNYNEYGRALIKNKSNDKKYLFNPWDTEESIGKSKLQKFISKTREFRKRVIDTYIFVGRSFRDNAKQFARTEKNMMLMEVNPRKKFLILYGSMNIESELLNSIIEFSHSIGFEISYDFMGVLKQQDGISKVVKIEKQSVPPKVFVSYSWDNAEHRHWVLKLAANLIKSGIIVLIDEWDLDKYRNDLHFFMESGIREADYVLIVCTPNYCQRANSRVGGVGVENTIITGELHNEEKGLKYIPVVRSYDTEIGECLPTYLKTKLVVDFKDDPKYESKIEELVRKIFGIPRYKRPQLGEKPNLITEEI